MGKTKFKVGDEVKIVSNEIQPQFCGKIGKVKKVYMTFQKRRKGVNYVKWLCIAFLWGALL